MSKQIEQLEQVLKSLKELLKAEKDVAKKNDNSANMDIDNTTASRRAKARDNLTSACQYRDKIRDNLHADLVDADLTDLREVEFYRGRVITVSCGHGHTNELKYIPKTPKRLANE